MANDDAIAIVSISGVVMVMLVMRYAERQQTQTYHLFGDLIKSQQNPKTSSNKKSLGETVGGLVESGVKLFASIF